LATVSEPLLAVLHVGYLWVVLGAALLGASVFTAAIPEAAAIHAFTAGAIGTVVLAVMTRVPRGHTGRLLEADRTTAIIYAAVIVAGATRVVAAFAGESTMLLPQISAILWIVAFLLFASAYGPMLVSPRVDEGVRPTSIDGLYPSWTIEDDRWIPPRGLILGDPRPTFLFLPPIAPNLNPIEMAFAKLKGLLGASAVRTIDALWRVIKQIGDIFSS
jgi:NnrS protein